MDRKNLMSNLSIPRNPKDGGWDDTEWGGLLVKGIGRNVVDKGWLS